MEPCSFTYRKDEGLPSPRRTQYVHLTVPRARGGGWTDGNRKEHGRNQTDTASVVFGMHVFLRKKKLIGVVVNIGWFKERNVGL